ncbi:MAG: adenosine-specific kinase [Firmicutes bacterium]|nr:adenosine-specific kinase [Candidatus Fermentithermobacillaceae bacterium]
MCEDVRPDKENYGIEVVPLDKPEDVNVILGQTHFIKSVEDLYEAMANAGGNIKFGIAFLEASGPCLVRLAGNDQELIDLAKSNALKLGTGHVFIIMMRQGYPINVLNNIKMVPEVCRIFAATANPLDVVVLRTGRGAGVLGVVDGYAPKGVETPQDVEKRKVLLRKIGYKL